MSIIFIGANTNWNNNRPDEYNDKIAELRQKIVSIPNNHPPDGFEENGLFFEEIYCTGFWVGFGVVIISYESNTIGEIDMNSLNREAVELSPKVKQAFEKWGLETEVKTFIVAD